MRVTGGSLERSTGLSGSPEGGIDDFSSRAGAALVTGASGGLGGAAARLLASRGATVALTYRSNANAVEQLAAAIRSEGGEASCHQLDLVDAERCAAVVSEVVDRHRAIHTLVHAAGPHVPQRHLSTVPAQDMRAQIEQDASGLFNLLSPAIPELRRSQGAIVAVTTAATGRYAVRDGLSAVPKAAVEMLIRAIAAEEGRFGIRANCVGPGMLSDGMAERLIASGDLDQVALEAARRNIPLRRFGTAADIAEAVVFLASDRAGYISGQLLAVDGGFGA